jgi:hypothetical protein
VSKRLSSSGLCVLAALLFTACAAPLPRHPVDAEIGYATLNTTVDSTLAARYLARFRSAFRPKASPDTQIDGIHARYDVRALHNDMLRSLAEETSPDFAATYFMRRILAEPRHHAIQKRFSEKLAALSAAERPRIEGGDPARYRFVFVPGLFYKSRPNNGAAMAQIRALVRANGFDTHFIETGDRSKVADGAQMLADYLIAERGSKRRIILVSASKGGADVAYALGTLLKGKKLDHVAGWISIGGVIRGTPLADVGLSWPYNWLLALTGWWHGATLGIAHDLAIESSAERAASYAFPDHLTVLHYVAVPFSGTITASVRNNYGSMRPFGPNDGVTLLVDQLLPQGFVLLAIGADHHFALPHADLRTIALATLILELVESSDASLPGAKPAPSSKAG